MDRKAIKAWVNDYVDAWRTPGTSRLAAIFSSDVTYQVSPWKPPITGLQELRSFWEKARAGSDELFKIDSRVIAVDGRIAIVKVEVEYAKDEPSRWRDLWIITFDDKGLCKSFEEWPFALGQEDGQDYN